MVIDYLVNENRKYDTCSSMQGVSIHFFKLGAILACVADEI